MSHKIDKLNTELTHAVVFIEIEEDLILNDKDKKMVCYITFKTNLKLKHMFNMPIGQSDKASNISKRA